MATLSGTGCGWTRREVCAKLKEAWPAPAGSVHRLLCGQRGLSGGRTLGDLGLDPTGPDGAELTAFVEPISESAQEALRAAVGAMETIDKASIPEVRTMNNPPVLVKMVLRAVVAVLGFIPNQAEVKAKAQGKAKGSQPLEMDQVKRVLGSAKFLSMLLNFDLDVDPDRVLAVLQPFMESPDFSEEPVRHVSKACVCLCRWCRAVYQYSLLIAGMPDV